MADENQESQNEAGAPESDATASSGAAASPSAPASPESNASVAGETAPAVSAKAPDDRGADPGRSDAAHGHGQGQGQRGDRRGRGRAGGGRGRDGGQKREPGEFEETVVRIYRCATVVKGGRRFSFAALVVVGNRNGKIGVGYGKANEVPNAVEKAGKIARRNVISIPLEGTSIPHQIIGRFGASKITLIPAGEGTGVIAGTSVRAVLELAGVKDVLTKSYGSNSPKNLVKAAFAGLTSLRSRQQVEKLRNVSLSAS